jgi:hypothetical protein
MKCLRIFPETMPRISRSELSSRSLNIALGNAVVTIASTSIGSDLANQILLAQVMTKDSKANPHGSLGWPCRQGGPARIQSLPEPLRDFVCGIGGRVCTMRWGQIGRRCIGVAPRSFYITGERWGCRIAVFTLVLALRSSMASAQTDRDFHFLGAGGLTPSVPFALVAAIDKDTASLNVVRTGTQFLGLDRSPMTGHLFAYGVIMPDDLGSGTFLMEIDAGGNPSGWRTAISLFDISFSPADELYGLSSNRSSLVKIDLQTGQTSSVPLSKSLQSIEFADDGTLYGHDGRLATVDLTTGAVTSFGILQHAVLGLDFAPDGKMYGVQGFGPVPNALVAIDLTSGASTTIGPLSIPMHSIVSIVPEPACSWALLLATLLSRRLGRCRGRRSLVIH